MGKLAGDWKKVKDNAENLCKQKQKAGRKAEFPKFKGDLQKSLDVFEAAVAATKEAKDKYLAAGNKMSTAGSACQLVIVEYEKAIASSDVDGKASKEEIKDPMLTVLKRIYGDIDKIIKGS
jgi:hypothetical protein